MICCPLCLTSPDRLRYTHLVRHYCQCARFIYNPINYVWTFMCDPDLDDYIDMWKDGTLKHHRGREKNAVPEGERDTFMRRYVESARVMEVMGS